MMEKNAKIYVAGHRGMVGSAICRALEKNGYTNIITKTPSKAFGNNPFPGYSFMIRELIKKGREF